MLSHLVLLHSRWPYPFILTSNYWQDWCAHSYCRLGNFVGQIEIELCPRTTGDTSGVYLALREMGWIRK